MTESIDQQAALMRMLAELRTAGAETWDAPGLAVVDRLLSRAQHAPTALAKHLLERTHAHLARLQQDYSNTRERAAEALSRLRAAEHPAQPFAAESLARGDTFLPRRLLRRAPHSSPRLRDELRRSLLEQLNAQAEARGISSPGLIESPDAQSRTSERPLALAQSLYRDAAAGAAARMTLAKTSASVPPDAGWYHPIHIAARTLEEAARHPAYLKAVLCRLETLSAIWHHGSSAPPQKRKRSTRRSTDAAR